MPKSVKTGIYLVSCVFLSTNRLLSSEFDMNSDRAFLVLVLVLALLGATVESATKTVRWEMSYITASPNGVARPVIGVNGEFPPHPIFVSKSDQVVIQVTNSLNDGEFITMHAHGILQNGTNYYDGVDQVTQWYYLSAHCRNIF